MTKAYEPNGNGHPKAGKGRSIAQHGELFQGQFEDRTGRRRCLLSLPCKVRYSEATFELRKMGKGGIEVYPPHKEKARRAVEVTLQHLNALNSGGTLCIHSTVPETKGCGSSTADCVAATIAAANAVGVSLAEEEIARLVVAAEVASDNFMFHRAVLFAQREGVILEDYTKSLPKLEVVGVDTAPDGHVETLKHPPAEYSWRQLQSFSTLIAALRRAIRKDELQLLGRVATASACINQQFLPKPMFAEIREIAESVGALGVSVAHSGTVMNVLLDPADDLVEKKIDQVRLKLEALGVKEVLRFRT